MRIGLATRSTVLSPEGLPVSRPSWRVSHSFVQQYVQGLRCQFTQSNESNVRDTSNVLRTLKEPFTSGEQFFKLVSGAGIDAFGCVVGDGSLVVDVTDFKLTSQLMEGVGANQLQHSAQAFGPFTQVGVYATVILTRTFSNGSGAQITVRETGLYFRWRDTGPIARDFCMARDVLAPFKDVPDGQSIVIDYRIRISA